ncbi:uncharacterized protein C8A04DRAFT_29636 [Dichotomopilus funicola]|uniref:Uncharacterized protein n=1 Tax=Dichotomopilus funicola TaxID=1934379 RepID=A0AAN6V0P4_9PEZI|nr:hypothetical protein C8A04DRAFT_29636 [Dichotomopilus funicola]
METLCNYTHPDLQNTTALARQPTGTLFPYNPDFYDLASGLYGPGNICTWYFLFASVFLHWLTGPRDADGHTHPGISADLIAVVAYPVFAATDLLVQGIKMIGTEDRALAIFCVRNPIVELEGMTDAFTQHEPLDMAGIPEEVVHFGQRVVDITGPLAVCYIFVDVSVVLAISLISEDILREYIPWRPTKMVRRFLFAGYGYVSLLLVVFHFSLGDVGISFFIALYEIIQPFLNAVTFGTTLVFGGAIVVGLVTGVVGIIRRDPAMMVDAAKVVGGMSIGALFPAFMITMTILNRVAIVPDLAVTITERDQLASLIAGILTLGEHAALELAI